MDPERRVLIVAGEASGDRHGAGLVREARAADPCLRFVGVGGRGMAQAGVEILQDVAAIGVVGLVEVIGCLPTLWRTYRHLCRMLRDAPPAACVLVDYPEFNLLLARRARRAGVPVLYFVSPQVWAWRRGRVATIARRVDRMLVILPFEEEIYREVGLPVEFVGHPLADEVRPSPDPGACRKRLGLCGPGPVVGLLPGSRRSELKRHLDPMLQAAHCIRESYPEARFVLPVASTLEAQPIRDRAAALGLQGLVVVEDALDDAVGACDVAAVASGTATLEVGLRQVPLVVVYATSPITYLLLRRFVRLPHVGLVNLVAGREVAPELIQHDFTPDRLAAELDGLLRDRERHRRVRLELEGVRRSLQRHGAYRRAAASLASLVPGGVGPDPTPVLEKPRRA